MIELCLDELFVKKVVGENLNLSSNQVNQIPCFQIFGTSSSILFTHLEYYFYRFGTWGSVLNNIGKSKRPKAPLRTQPTQFFYSFSYDLVNLLDESPALFRYQLAAFRH